MKWELYNFNHKSNINVTYENAMIMYS